MHSWVGFIEQTELTQMDMHLPKKNLICLIKTYTLQKYEVL